MGVFWSSLLDVCDLSVGSKAMVLPPLYSRTRDVAVHAHLYNLTRKGIGRMEGIIVRNRARFPTAVGAVRRTGGRLWRPQRGAPTSVGASPKIRFYEELRTVSTTVMSASRAFDPSNKNFWRKNVPIGVTSSPPSTLRAGALFERHAVCSIARAPEGARVRKENFANFCQK